MKAKYLIGGFLILGLLGCQSQSEVDVPVASQLTANQSGESKFAVIRWKICGLSQSQNPDKCEVVSSPSYHWMPVEGIKLAPLQNTQPNKLFVYLKSRGCLRKFSQPQESAFYEDDKSISVVEGDKPTIEIVSTEEKSPSENSAVISYVQQSGSLSPCRALND